MDKIKIFISKARQNLTSFVKNNWFLVVILLIGAFLRLYRIGDFMTFLGDEGRDAIIVRRLLVDGDPILIGPGTSIGNMYLGPLYYYLIAIPLLVANFSPIGPSIFVALLGIITIYFVYYVGRIWFSEKVGLIASLLYAISPTVIIYSRSSWNPNVMPFFALLCIFSIWKVYSEKQYKWLLVLGASFAFVLQTHYLGLLLAPVLFIYWLLTYLKIVSKSKNWDSDFGQFIKKSAIALAIFSFLMSPLLIFDIRHNWMNTRALYKFFTVRQETVSIRPWAAIPKTYPIFEQINTSLLTANNKNAGRMVTLGIVLSVGYLLIKKRSTLNSGFYIVVLWTGFALIGFGLYKQNIYDHYFGFVFPSIILLFSALSGRLNKTLLTIIVLVLVYLNLKASPVMMSPNYQMRRAYNVAEKVISESGDKKFNVAVLAERNYEDGYQYFMERRNAKMVEIDAQIKESITDQLFAICELPKEKCNPVNSPKAEVANFGWSKIENQWEVDGVTIYKLIHNYPDKK